jgi:hypothetical protein
MFTLVLQLDVKGSLQSCYTGEGGGKKSFKIVLRNLWMASEDWGRG